SGSAEVRPCVVGLGRRPFQVIARSVKKHLSTSLMMASHESACICPEESRKHLLNDFQFAAVDAWYARRASVRNLWVIEERYRLRILVTLEPAPDDSDTSPAWIANCHAWVDELQRCTNLPVQLELVDEPALNGATSGLESVIV